MIQHPMYGAGHKYRTLHLPISTTLAEVLDRVSGMFQERTLHLLTPTNCCMDHVPDFRTQNQFELASYVCTYVS